LNPGEYQLVEIQAPTGYELNSTPVTFTIEKGQTKAIEVKKTNTLTTGGVILTKIDGTDGNPLQGAIFTLENTTGDKLQTGLTTDSAGKIAVNQLAPGKYQLVETQAPTGYQLDEKPIKFSIEKGQVKAVEVEKTNEKIKGSVTLEKYDKATGQSLAGAIFQFQDSNHKTLIKNMVTGQSGKLTVTKLVPGTYYFVETQAPKGYQLDATPVKVVVKNIDGASQTVRKGNIAKTHTIRIIKKDQANKMNLAGATFDLYDNQGKVVKQGVTTDKSGVLEISQLTAGVYLLKETKAPTGYLLNTEPISITIKDADNLVTLDVYNVKPEVPVTPKTPNEPNEPNEPNKPNKSKNPTNDKTKVTSGSPNTYELPKTGENTSEMAVIIGSFLIGLTALSSVVFYRKNKM
jgi:LPXTG-motif cell wall-anchored protein